MIRLIHERDYQDLFQLLNEDTISNYFILISYFGNLNKLAKVYGFFDNNKMQAVLVIRNSGNAQFYCSKEQAVDIEALKNLLEAQQVLGLIAEKTCIEPFVKHYGYIGKKQATVMDLSASGFKRLLTDDAHDIVELKSEDAAAVKKLYRICFEGSLSEDQMKKNLQDRTGRGLAIKNGEAILSVVQTIFESPQSAILFGVATDPIVRKKGYATRILNQLLDVLAAEGKSVHLMVEDPIAASLYQKIGFIERTTLEKYKCR
jgi:predicted GNAT family acetyltransferase